MAKNTLKRRGAQATAPAVPAPAQVFQGRLDLRRRMTVVLLNLLTVALLSIAFAPFNIWPAAYIALVPWVMSLAGSRHSRWALLCGWGGGLVFALLNLYWLTWITLPGYAATAAYLSVYWLAAGLMVRAAVRRNWPMWVVLPVAWVSLEYVRSTLISGFPWFLLAHTQYMQTRLIQIADVTGQYGVSFFVAMVNGAVVDLFCSPLFCRWRTGKAGLSRRFAAGGAACVLATAALLGYGQWRLSQSAGEDGPVIAVVQHAYPISLEYDDYASTPEIFDSFVASSAPLGGAGLDLLVWPETMLPTGLNPQVLQVDLASLRGPRLRALGRHLLGPAAEDPKYTDDDVRLMLEGKIHGGDESWRVDEPSLHQYAARLSELTVRLGCPLLGGGATVAPQDSPLYPDDYYVHRNSAMWFDGSPVARARYDKVKLVPFGEYVPFKYGWPALHRALRWFVPEVMDQLDPGREDTRFVLTRGGRTWRLVTPICYEGVFASRCRELVMDGGRKSADVMVNLSNDGWFIHQDSRRTCRPSTELDQHLAQYCFRAVECRVPVVRAVNTGVSASIDSGGAILSVVRQRVGGRWQRGMADGTLVLDGQKGRDGRYLQGHGPKVLVDRRVSLYSCWGDVFAWTVCLAGMPMVGVLYWRRGRAGGPEPAVIKGER